MSPSWIWSDKITNERAAQVGYNHFISNKGEWNNCFSKFSNRVLPSIFISTILQSVRKENLTHYFPYDVKLGLLAHSRRFLANQKARNAIVGTENLLNVDSNESGQNRREWLEILKVLCSLMCLIFKTSSVTPDFFYVFKIILSFSTCSQSFEKVCTWELLGANILN